MNPPISGTSPAPAGNAAPGPPVPIVPDHDLLRRIGRGSYGEVWLARNVMGSFRAVKVVYRASFESDRPYEREFSGLQKFEPVSRSHPGLVSVLHMGRNADAGYFYCIMEVADDQAAGQAIVADSYQPRTLGAELARRGRLPLAECLDLATALASALSYLHSRGLVHRDIKPSNIIFVNGQPKFADIGLVTQIGSQATFVGTEGYLPPEGPGSPAADLYSLGRVLYEISLGKSQEQFPELPTRLRELPEAASLMRLNALVLRACQPQPAKRFRSAEEFQAALAQLRLELPGSTASPPDASSGRPAAGTRVFIIASAAEPAELPFARRLLESLNAAGYAAFLDDRSVLSLQWARDLEQQVRAAQVVVPILTPTSVQSELMAYALEVAAQAARRPVRLPRLAAVRLAACQSLPRQIALALEGSTAIVCEDYNQACNQILEFLNLPAKAPSSNSTSGS